MLCMKLRLKIGSSTVVLISISLAMACIWAPNVEAASLRAGVAVQDITSDAPTKNIHDPLYAKALVLDDGATKAVIICVDIISASDTLVSEVRRQVQKELGINQKNVLLNASHNHHTWNQTAEDMTSRIVQAVEQAASTTVPVKIGVGVGYEDRISMNRRLRLKNGKEWTIRRANPSPQDSEVVGLGSMDTEIGILRLDKVGGGILAVLYNFAVHPYGGIPDGSVTADLPGFASRVIEEAMGPGAVALFVQGAAGDITPIRYKDFDAPPPTERLGMMLGRSVIVTAKRLPMKEQSDIKVVSEIIELPKRQDVAVRIESLEEQQEEILRFFAGIGCGAHGAGTSLNFKSFLPLYIKYSIDPNYPSYSSYLYLAEQTTDRKDLKHLDAANKKRVGKYLQCIHKMEELIRLQTNLQILKRHLREDDSRSLVVEIQGIRIGEFILVTFPGELFAEVGLRLKKQSPFPHTFIAAYSNGNIGYAPTADVYQNEAYEDVLTRLSPHWQQLYETKALATIGELR
ncbi:neutral/alkaline non-lysosomal ceramidase N-terminal domain-containing protein [Planctomycetota bacterium]